MLPSLSGIAQGRLAILVLAIVAGLVVADGNDWVNVRYVTSQSNTTNTADARQTIVQQAGTYARSGLWSVTKSPVKPPSGDLHDYLSWAPYHWPDCNWCSQGTNHLSGPNQGGNGSDTDDPDTDPGGGSDDPYEDGGDYEAWERRAFRGHRRMMARRRGLLVHGIPDHGPRDLANGLVSIAVGDVSVSTFPLPTNLPDVGDPPTVPTRSSSVKTINGTPAPAQAPAKTEKNKCTPSPTKSLAPSATWTTCPYEVRDGKVNPDVRMLPDSPAAVAMSQAVLYNALAFAMKNTRSYSQNAAKFIDAFFLASSTAMNPNMNFGQVVRGPGKEHQMGTFTGILDLRGIVKVTNAIAILKATGSPDWTSAREKAMADWMRSYASWLENSAIGKETASKANNHLTFYVNQLAAVKMHMGDRQGAQVVLKNYFLHQFRDQVAASGEQPFEAVRTRPFHYRCFNLEAMITNAKLGDELGMDFWTVKSKYGATIQTALDYAMSVNPKQESIADIFPHVAAVAAAYGDPQGKYAAFLRSKDKDYKSQAFWFYDQSSALPQSPAGRSNRRRDFGLGFSKMAGSEDALSGDLVTMEAMSMEVVRAVKSGEGPFECPEVFKTAKEAELEVGLSVTCDDLKPYYEIMLPVNPA